MADNVTLNAGSGGSVIKTDDDGTAHWQYTKLAYGADNTQTRVENTAPLPVHDRNLISTNNSTTSTLAGDAVYTGTADDVSQYTAITIQLDSSHDSATDGMTFEFSSDNTNWDDVYTFTYLAANGARRFQFPVTAQYFRVVYTNGSTIQTHFRVQTILHSSNQLTSVHRLGDNTSSDRSAQVIKSAIIAQTSGSGDFVPIAANASGKLQVSAETAGANTPADAFANPTDATPSQSFNMVYNGATWDLVREGGVAGSILVDGSGSTQPVSGTVTANTALSGIISERVADTAGNSTDFTNFAAGGAGVRNYITTISIYNSSGTDVYVDFRDGSAGAIVFTAAAPQAGGSVINLPVPIRFAENTAVAYDVSAAASTVYISVVGFQA